MPPVQHNRPHLVLLYDGRCSFCNWAVQLVITHDTQGRMYFAALEGPYGSQLIARHPWLATVDSVVLVETTADGTERIFVRSTAILQVAAYLGGWWQWLTLGYLIPVCLRDWLYDAFARVRYQLFGRYDSCPVPPSGIRARFL